ncbi:MAG: hypothetical protein ACK56W_06515 [Pirellula sp.]|nr:hypothetical protein [Pirellula sp.]
MLGRVGYVIIAIMLVAQTGCLVVRQPGSNSCEPVLIGNGLIRTALVGNAGDGSASDCSSCESVGEMPCELYDRKEVLKRWLHAARPSNIIPQRVQDLGAKARDQSIQIRANQKQRCDALAANCGEKCEEWKAWWEMKKRDANPPPWPKFHPVPARPAFSRSEMSLWNMPDAYGTIGTE